MLKKYLRQKYILGSCFYMGGVQYLPELFNWSWGQMIQYNTQYLHKRNSMIYYDRITSSYHTFARNSMVKRMRGDWILMLDTDVRFDPDLVERMLKTMDTYNIQVLTGLYIYKNYPRLPVIYNYNEQAKKNEIIATWDKELPFQVSAAGGGCLMIKRWVFDYIQQELNEEPFSIIPPFSEDLSFFERIKKLGIPAYCDPTIEVNHLTVTPLSYEEHADVNKIPLGKEYAPHA